MAQQRKTELLSPREDTKRIHLEPRPQLYMLNLVQPVLHQYVDIVLLKTDQAHHRCKKHHRYNSALVR